MLAARLFLTVALLTGSLSFAGWTQVGAGSVTFDAKGPAGFKIHGGSEKAVVVDDGKTLQVSVKMEDVDTDNGLRNKHMLEDAGAREFPTVTLSVPVGNLKETGAAIETTGTFELHGQKKETKFTYTPKCEAGACDIEGSANLNLGDFGIKIRSYLGVTVKPEIVVGARFKLKK